MSPPEMVRGRLASDLHHPDNDTNRQQQRYRTGETIPQQLHQRRVASLRLPPLDNGKRDPIDILASYSSEPLRLFWRELHARGLLTEQITAELTRLARRGAAR